MLVEFRFKNFRSFADEAFVQFDAATAFKEEPGNLIQTKDGALLKSIAVYGANASGKSNIVAALSWFRSMVLLSAKKNSTDGIETFPFALDQDLVNAPTLVEIRFLVGDIYYRYGFESTAAAVVSEWLLWARKIDGKDWILFTREGENIEYGNSYRGDKLYGKDILNNTLLLSRLDQANVEIAAIIMKCVKDIRIVSGLRHDRYVRRTMEMLEVKDSRPAVLAFTQLADYTVQKIARHEVEDIPQEYATYLERHHLPRPQEIGLIRKANTDSGSAELSLARDESAGTGKMFGLAGVWVSALEQGQILVVDELEAKLHPLLTRFLVRMFNSATVNKNRAQLLFVTHDATLMEQGGLRRDQIWFCEKNRDGKSVLYSLAEIKESGLKRKDSPVEKNYIEGKYGAIPFFGEWEKLVIAVTAKVFPGGQGDRDGASN